MNVYRYFIASSYALIATSFAMLAATRRVDAVTMTLFVVVLAAGWTIDTGRLAWAMSRWWANGLIVAVSIAAVAAWQFLDVSMVAAIIYLTLFASSLKLLRWKTNRDWMWLYAVSFCLVLMTAGMTLDAVFLALLVIYLFAALLTLISLEIRRSQMAFATAWSERNPGAELNFRIEFGKEALGARRIVSGPRGHSLPVSSAAMLALIAALAAPIFLVMPRVTRGASRNGLLATETLSGFSDSVRLGEVAQVKLNPQVVMRVRVGGPRGPSSRHTAAARWRGVTLDYYDGQSWSETGEEMTRVSRIGESFQVDDRLYEERRGPRRFTEQRFFVEPLNISTVFVAPRPLIVTGLRNLARDAGDGLWTEDHSYFKLDYTVYSDTSVPADAELAAANSRDYPRDIKLRYLQLPRDHDLRINDLAAEVAREARSTIETARLVESHLRERYGYTLDLRRVEEGDPVADFLFNTRAGHCEYFASAMVLMMRARQIPARLVNGFQTGEYNAAADIYTVRQSDAHSWVEVYFPKFGWIAFDPTPPAGLSQYGDGWAAMFRQWQEAMEMMWLENVVGFDTGKQVSLIRGARQWLSSFDFNISSRWLDWTSGFAMRVDRWHERASDPLPSDSKPSDRSIGSVFKSPLLWALLGLAVPAGLIAALRRRGASWRRKVRNDAKESAIRFYQEMLRLVERAGHRREPHQTPSEFAAQLTLPGVAEITRLYERTRFGDEQLTVADISRIDALLRELKTHGGERRPRRLLRFRD